MEPLMSTSKSHERFDYSPRPSEELFDSKEDIGRKSKIAPKVFIWFLAFTWLIAAAILVAIYHRVTYLQNCTCQEMNDAGSNLLVNGDSSIISKVARPYHYLEPGFDIDDFVAADPLWASLFPEGGGVVFLTQDYITSRRLPASAVSPNRPGNKSVYEIAGYHSLHCVSALRANLWRAKNALQGGAPFDIEEYWYHVVHCLADLRQYIMCNFDETLLRVTDLIHHPGQEQLKLCTSTEPIDQWIGRNYH